MRNTSPLPEDPVEHLRDYFGKHRDPTWDLVDLLTQENIEIEEAIPSLEDKIKMLETEVDLERKKNQVIDAYNALDTEKTVLLLPLNNMCRMLWDTN